MSEIKLSAVISDRIFFLLCVADECVKGDGSYFVLLPRIKYVNSSEDLNAVKRVYHFAV
jgi:hypothetical protein